MLLRQLSNPTSTAPSCNPALWTISLASSSLMTSLRPFIRRVMPKALIRAAKWATSPPQLRAWTCRPCKCTGLTRKLAASLTNCKALTGPPNATLPLLHWQPVGSVAPAAPSGPFPPCIPWDCPRRRMFLRPRVLNPFMLTAILDDDLLFAAKTMGLLGPCLASWRNRQLKAVAQLAQKATPWDNSLCSLMAPSVRAVAANKRPAFLLLASILLRWPDRRNALRFVTGHNIVGCIENSSLFRPVQVAATEKCGLESLLGHSALETLTATKARVRPTERDAQLRQACLEEVAAGQAAGPFSEQELNARCSPGQWRPLERFLLEQGEGKLRCIDSGKKPGHNNASRESETIYTSSVDSLLPIIRATCDAASVGALADAAPEYLSFQIGTEDMQHAYRQCPVSPQHLCVSTVAYWDHVADDHRFLVLHGPPFGLSSSVLCFNRTPALMTAVCRRWTASAVLQFFDDSGVCDLTCARGSGQAALRTCHSLAGIDLDSLCEPFCGWPVRSH